MPESVEIPAPERIATSGLATDPRVTARPARRDRIPRLSDPEFTKHAQRVLKFHGVQSFHVVRPTSGHRLLSKPHDAHQVASPGPLVLASLAGAEVGAEAAPRARPGDGPGGPQRARSPVPGGRDDRMSPRRPAHAGTLPRVGQPSHGSVPGSAKAPPAAGCAIVIALPAALPAAAPAAPVPCYAGVLAGGRPANRGAARIPL